MTVSTSGRGEPAEISFRMLSTDSLDERPNSFSIEMSLGEALRSPSLNPSRRVYHWAGSASGYRSVVPGIEDVAQAVAGEVERQGQHEDRQPRPVRHPRRLL